MKTPSVPPRGNELLERLIELEAVKHEALLEFDADAYETATSEQTGLVSAGTLEESALARDRVVVLAKQIRLNSALLLNLISISPYFALMQQGYTAGGGAVAAPSSRLRLRG